MFQVTGITKHNPVVQAPGQALPSLLKLLFALPDDDKLIDCKGKIDLFVEWVQKTELYSILSG